MLISIDDLVKKYNLTIRGVIVAGAHYLEEYDVFRKNGAENIIAFEPCNESYNVMIKRFGGDDLNGLQIVNSALSDKEGDFEMYSSKDNSGQSNSLLKPKLHLQQHPSIVFDERELVKCLRLDDVPFDRSLYNMLYMDVQGGEGEVIKGGKETLDSIDIIYTEVNGAEVYENCTQIDELDKLLSDFERVETKWAGMWGDSLYLRHSILNV